LHAKSVIRRTLDDAAGMRKVIIIAFLEQSPDVVPNGKFPIDVPGLRKCRKPPSFAKFR
jgi:hypothetical protein